MLIHFSDLEIRRVFGQLLPLKVPYKQLKDENVFFVMKRSKHPGSVSFHSLALELYERFKTNFDIYFFEKRPTVSPDMPDFASYFDVNAYKKNLDPNWFYQSTGKQK